MSLPDPSPKRSDRRAKVAREDVTHAFEVRCREHFMAPSAVESLVRRGLKFVSEGRSAVESPIEYIMVAPLVFADWSPFVAMPAPIYLQDSDAYAPDSDIIIVPQMKFMRFRADFGIICQAGDARKVFFVECDGQEFHRDVLRDQQRDNYLKSLGVTLIRLTGSEISASPLAAVQRVVFVVTAWKDARA